MALGPVLLPPAAGVFFWKPGLVSKDQMKLTNIRRGTKRSIVEIFRDAMCRSACL